MIEAIEDILLQSWIVLGQMSPYLFLGFLVAGVLSVFISPQWIERHLGGRGFGPIFKASLFGVPLPLCSCGVIPVSASIRRHGASRAATVAFLLSTPQTGVDSIAATWALLGPVFAIFRPVAALVTGVIGGVLVRTFDPDRGSAVDGQSSATCADSCCTDRGQGSGVARAARYGFLTLPRDIGVALLIGVLIAGAMAALVPQGSFADYIGASGGVLSILIMMAVGVPLYVCATASIPIAAGLMHMGASPGAALAFLIAGPATNAATFTTIWKVLGHRTAILYILTVAVAAVVCGLLLNGLMDVVVETMPDWAPQAHAHNEIGWATHAMAAVLLVVLAASYLVRDRGGEGVGHGTSSGSEAAGEQRIELRVTGMTCSHCAGAVERALQENRGVRAVEVDLAGNRAIVLGANVDLEQLIVAIDALGYNASLVE